MTWNSADNANTYTLAWNVDGGSYTEVSGITGTGYTHTGLTNGAYYCYKVRGMNTDGSGEYSIPQCTAPDTLPVVPTNVSAS